MVSGNNDVPNNNDRVVMVLREIGKHLDVAEALGADLIRIGMKAHTDRAWINGPVNYNLLPFGDPRGVDFRAVFDALGEVGYNGYVTVHQVGTGMDIPTGAQHFADYLRSVASFE